MAADTWGFGHLMAAMKSGFGSFIVAATKGKGHLMVEAKQRFGNLITAATLVTLVLNHVIAAINSPLS